MSFPSCVLVVRLHYVQRDGRCRYGSARARKPRSDALPTASARATRAPSLRTPPQRARIRPCAPSRLPSASTVCCSVQSTAGMPAACSAESSRSCDGGVQHEPGSCLAGAWHVCSRPAAALQAAAGAGAAAARAAGRAGFACRAAHRRAVSERDFSSFIIGDGRDHRFRHGDDEVAQHRVVELERVLELAQRFLVALDVHQHVVRLVNLLDRVGELAPAPVLETVDPALVAGRPSCCSARPSRAPARSGRDGR